MGTIEVSTLVYYQCLDKWNTKPLAILSGKLAGYALWLMQEGDGVVVRLSLLDNSTTWWAGRINDPYLVKYVPDEEDDMLEYGHPTVHSVTLKQKRLSVLVDLERFTHGQPGAPFKGKIRLPKSTKKKPFKTPAAKPWAIAGAACLAGGKNSQADCKKACAAGLGVACLKAGDAVKGCKLGSATACGSAAGDEKDPAKSLALLEAGCKGGSEGACGLLRVEVNELTDGKTKATGKLLKYAKKLEKLAENRYEVAAELACGH